MLLIVAVLVGGLAAVRLPAAHPGRSASQYLVAALVTLVAFGLCAVAHELAHVVTRGELAGAAAGPLVSLGLGGLLGVTTVVLTVTGAGGLSVSVTAYVGLANLALAAVTLLPGESSDGGRMLRAWIWRTTGDARRASRGATRAGHAIGYAFLLGGVVSLVGGAAVVGIWLALTGWFVAAQL
ncbi:MAG: hypothetical protein HOV77_14530 [Hamadaea sp.]|uniref:hypothetical protein n=1 Tax=Hamadaea sp. TaxID=2024425 RepID=UPI0017A0D62B|nr:hypothetical protein [Hamadaea sp.]NUT20399.1 hypothetical protein [Hamadaea sp.]